MTPLLFFNTKTNMAYTIPWGTDPLLKKNEAIRALQMVSGTTPVSDVAYNLEDAGIPVERNLLDPFETDKNLTALDQIKAGAENKLKAYTAEDIKAMSADELKSLFGSSTFKSQKDKIYGLPEGLGQKATSLIKPALGIGTVLMNLQKLKDTRAAAKNIHAPRIDAAVTGVRPVQDLTPEMLNMYYKQLGGMKTQKTSDAVSNIIANQMLEQQKLGMLSQLGLQRAENLRSERARYDEAKAKNVVAAVEARNKQEVEAVKIANRKAAIDAAYESEKQNMWNKVAAEAQEGLHQRAMYNMAAEIQNKEVAKQKLATMINQTERMLAGATDQATKTKLQGTLTDLLAKYQTEDYTGYEPKFKLPSYSGLIARAFSPQMKKGGKLLPKKACSGRKAKCGKKIN